MNDEDIALVHEIVRKEICIERERIRKSLAEELEKMGAFFTLKED